jgi:glycosyltransferase involved in cell wall biosynthesis
MIDDAILMPVYNEALTVESVLDAIRLHHHGEVLVINDGSTDQTGEILAERDDILVVTHPENMGYGKSLIDGFTFAQFAGLKRVITMDCDGQHEPKHIPQFFEALTDEVDLVSGSRYLPQSGSEGEVPKQRREINDTLVAKINSVTGWGITDAFCGFKAYHVDRVMALGLQEPGYALPMELWAKAWKAGWKVVELPVERIYFDHDRSFGADLDDPAKRLAYYERVWRAALEAGE